MLQKQLSSFHNPFGGYVPDRYIEVVAANTKNRGYTGTHFITYAVLGFLRAAGSKVAEENKRRVNT